MKKLTQALCVAAMVFAFASCDKDDTTPTPNYPLDGTSWLNETGSGDSYEAHRIDFGPGTCIMTMTIGSNTQQDGGTYTYSGTLTSGSGSITLNHNGRLGDFTVDGERLTVTSEGRSMELTRIPAE